MRNARCFVIFMSCLFGLPARAGDPPRPAEEVVVTAARVPVPVAASGAGVTVISRAEIERRRPQYVFELLRDVPGFSLIRSGGRGAYSQVSSRGAPTNHLLVLIDGVEANDFSQNDDFDFAHLQASEVERIEIVRGPQSALWGSDAAAGVINIITRRARHAREISAASEFGSLGTQLYSAALGAMRGNLNGRVGLSYTQASGVNVSGRGAEDDGNRNGSLNFKLGWTPLEVLALDLFGRITDAETELDSPDFIDGLNRDIDSTTDTTQGYVGGKAELRTLDGLWTHTVTGGWTRLDNATRNPDFGGLSRTRGRKYSLDYQSTWRLDTDYAVAAAHSLVAAVDYDLEEFAQRGPILFGDPNQDRRRHTLGYVLEYRVSLARGTTAGVSGRWDDNSDFADIGTYRVSLAQEFPTGTTLSVAYGTGHKAPTFSERYGFFANGGFLPFVGNAALEPEQTHGYEVGISQAWFDRRIDGGVTYFNEHVTDEIDGNFFDATTNTLTARNRLGTSKRRGLETNLNLNFTEHTGVRATYTYLDATDETNGVRLDTIRRPRHQGSVSGHWRGLAERLTLDGGVEHSGERPDLLFFPLTGRTTLAAYTLGYVSASYQLRPRVALTARLENMFDDTYQEVFDFGTEGINAHLGIRFESAD